jgi:hypothetical protein
MRVSKLRLGYLTVGTAIWQTSLTGSDTILAWTITVGTAIWQTSLTGSDTILAWTTLAVR